MIVKNIRNYAQDEHTVCTADIIFESSPTNKFSYKDKVLTWLRGHGIKKTVWFKIPDKHFDENAIQDAFFLLTYPLALKCNESLVFKGEISAQLFYNTSQIKQNLGLKKAKTEISISKFSSSQFNKNKKSAQFFTLGVDSFHTLLIHKPHYLIFIDGYDIQLDQKSFLNHIHSRIHKVALKTKTSPIFITSNIRDISDDIMNWELYYGAALAAAGLLAGKHINSIWINGSYFPTDIIHGSTKKLDPLWSTEYLMFKPTGYSETRLEKILAMQKLTHFDLVLNHLRVCWRNIYEKDIPYNCSKCEKCLRTFLAFYACNLPVRTFKDIDFSKLPEFKIPHISLKQWKSIYAMMKKNHKKDKQVLHFMNNLITESLIQ